MHVLNVLVLGMTSQPSMLLIGLMLHLVCLGAGPVLEANAVSG